MLYLERGSYHPTPPRLAHPPEPPVFPFDKIALRISQELERVGWDVPGWDVTLRAYGTGDGRWVGLSEVVGHVAGAHFRLSFERADGGLGTIGVPHRDGKPPMSLRVGTQLAAELMVYCGDKWDDEFADFYRWSCLDAWKYSEVEGDFVADGSRTLAGVSVAAAVAHADRWLNVVCDRLAPMPTRLQPIDQLVQADPEPLPQPVRAWAVVPPAIANRVRAHHEGREVPASMRFAALPTRAVCEDTFLVDAPDCAALPQAWLSLTPPNLTDPMSYLVHRAALCMDPVILEARIRVGNDATVIDFAAFLDEQAKLLAGRGRLDDKDVWSCWAAAARTAVPLADYRGGYLRPVLLLARELRLDEVSIAA